MLTFIFCLFSVLTITSCSAEISPPATTASGTYYTTLVSATPSASVGLDGAIVVTWEDVGASSYTLYALDLGDDSSLTEFGPFTSSDASDGIFTVTDPTVSSNGIFKSYYLTTVNKYTTSSGATASESVNSGSVIGATLPALKASYFPNEDSITITWSIDDVKVGDSVIYPDGSFTVSILKDGNVIASPSSSERSYTDSDGITSEQSYTYSVLFTFLESSAAVSSGSVEVTASKNYRPDPVSTFSVSEDRVTDAGDIDTIQLDWTQSIPTSFTFDDTFNVRFTLERSVKDEDNWTTLTDYDDTQFDAVLDSASASGASFSLSYSYVDTGLDNNTEYTYRITSAFVYGENDEADIIYEMKDDAVEATGRTVYLPSLSIGEVTYEDNSNESTRTYYVSVSLEAGDYDLPSSLSGVLMYKEQTSGGDWIEATSYANSIHTITYSQSEVQSPKTLVYEIAIVKEGTTIYSIASSEVATLPGTLQQVEMMGSFSISSDRYSEITLTWTLDDTFKTEYADCLNSLEVYVTRRSSLSDAGEVIYSNTDTSSTTLSVSDSTYTITDTIGSESETKVFYYDVTLYVTYGTETLACFVSNESGGLLEHPAFISSSKTATAIELQYGMPAETSETYTLQWTYSDESSWTDASYTTAVSSDNTYDRVVTFTVTSDIATASRGREMTFRLTTSDAYSSSVSLDSTASFFGPYGLNLTIGDASNSEVSLSWSEIDGATYYGVYRYESGASSYTSVKTVTTNSYTHSYDEDSDFSADYCYTVVPMISASDSSYSAGDMVSAGFYVESNLVAPPHGMSVSTWSTADSTVGAETIKLSWEAVPQTSGYYKIYRRKAGESTWTTISSSVTYSTTTYLDSDVEANTEYEYGIQYVCSDGSDITSVMTNSSCYTSNVGSAYFGLIVASPLSFDSSYSETTLSVTYSYGTSTISLKNTFTGESQEVSVSATASSASIDVTPSLIGALNDIDNKTHIVYFDFDITATNEAGLSVTVEDAIASTNSVTEVSGSAYVADVYHQVAVNSSSWYQETYVLDSIACDFIESMKTPFSEANTSFTCDWWGSPSYFLGAYVGNDDAQTYSGSKITITNSSSTIIQSAGSLALTDYTSDSGSLIFTTTEDIGLYAEDDGFAGYLSTDSLKYIGYDNSGYVKLTLNSDYYNTTGYDLYFRILNIYASSSSYNDDSRYVLGYYDSSDSFVTIAEIYDLVDTSYDRILE